MVYQLIELLNQFLGPGVKHGEDYRKAFYLIQIFLGSSFVLLLIYFRPKGPESGFRDRDENKGPAPFRSAFDIPIEKKSNENRQKAQPSPPQLLEGISLNGLPHEILGVSPDADLAQIQRAYRNLMKRYHPDRVGRQGTRAWTDAQKIAEVINRAKELMVKKHGKG